jgi:hypothetical protein
MAKTIAPPKLYKYQSCNEEVLTNLREHRIGFRRPITLNDPYDCNFELHLSSVSEDDLLREFKRMRPRGGNKAAFNAKYLTDGKPNDRFKEDIFKGFKEQISIYRQTLLNDRGITCFSEIGDNLLMWSHYTRGHTGFCLEFDTSFHPFEKLYQVHYAEENSIPTVNPILAHFQEEDFFERMILTKAKCWCYEQEWRIFHKQGGDRTENYPPECLTAVYFGINMPREHKFRIMDILKDSPVRNGFFEMSKDNEYFRLIPRNLPRVQN